MSIAKKLWYKYTKIFGATIFHPQFFSYRYIVRDAKRAAPGIMGTLVDIGCGTKPYMKYFADRVEHYVGLDYPHSQESADSATSTPPDIYANALQIPIKSASVDIALLAQVLEHIPDPRRTLDEIARILKTNATLIITVPMLYPIHSAPHDYFRFTEHGLTELLTGSGFHVTELRRNGGFTATVTLFVNVFLMHKIFNLAAQKWASILALILMPLVILGSTITNTISYILQPLDRERKFTHGYFVTAKRNEKHIE